MFGALFVVFGVAALFMASVGLYGVLSFSVSRKTNEIGIRMALGAGALDVVKLVLRQGATHLGIGVGIGLVLAVGLLMTVAPMMFEAVPFDPLVLVVTIAVITLVGLSASLVPAVRATQIDPVEALRYQ